MPVRVSPLELCSFPPEARQVLSESWEFGEFYQDIYWGVRVVSSPTQRQSPAQLLPSSAEENVLP